MQNEEQKKYLEHLQKPVNKLDLIGICDSILGDNNFKGFDEFAVTYSKAFFSDRYGYWGSTVALHTLIKDGYLLPIETKDPNGDKFTTQYHITPIGQYFIENGGYKGEIKKKEIEQNNKADLDAAAIAIANSVTATNKFTINTAKKNNKIIVLTMIVAAVSALSTIGTFLKGCGQDRLTPVQILQTQQQKQSTSQPALLGDTPNMWKAAKDSLKKK
jgi:hypothetical protein